MAQTPLLVLLSPRCGTSPARALALGTRACFAAAMYAAGVDVFAPRERSLDGREDPRSAIGGAKGQALAREPLRTPSGFVTFDLEVQGDRTIGCVRLIDGDDLSTRAEAEVDGDAWDYAEFVELALREILGDLGIELPVGWPMLLGTQDAVEAVVRLTEDGADLDARTPDDEAATLPN